MTFVTLREKLQGFMFQVSVSKCGVRKKVRANQFLLKRRSAIAKYSCSFFILLLFGCKERKKEILHHTTTTENAAINYATGFSIEKQGDLTLIKITSPWPDSESTFTYALFPKEKLTSTTFTTEAYDAFIATPVERIVVTSTTHIPALEALGVSEKLIGFPDTRYISSERTRKLVESGAITELGHNETLNTELVLELKPDLLVGFSIDNQNKSYETLQRSHIPVVYNGDWTEETPLGKAEWIKFFAPFFQKERLADSIFHRIEKSYLSAKALAKTAATKPQVMSGALYKDVWYCPGGKSWAAQFLKDASANYIWETYPETGSLSLNWEAVLEAGQQADFWIGPAQHTSYEDLSTSSLHYEQFDAFNNKKVFTFAKTKGATGGLLYYELAPHRPDMVLKDLIHIFHPQLLPDHEPYFFKPLD